MKLIELVTTEDYHSLITSPLNKRKYPIFINPDRNEIRELAKETNLIRFIAFRGNFYLFNGALLHAFVIKHLDLPISDNPSISQAFLGVAKANLNGTIEYYDSNQLKEQDIDKIPKLYPYISRWFK